MYCTRYIIIIGGKKKMNHKVNSVSNLHVDGTSLFKNLVVGTSDFSSATIIKT